MFKNCLHCKLRFTKPFNESQKCWETRHRFCSRKCYDENRRGKPSPSPSTTFIKGNVPWNKGLEGFQAGGENPRWKGDALNLNCKICSKEFRVTQDRIATAKFCSVPCKKVWLNLPEVRLERSVAEKKRITEKIGEFRSALTALDKVIRHSLHYQLWREEVFKRDDYSCVFCGHRGDTLRADHIKQFALILIQNDVKTYDDARRCGELWDMNNVRTLCHSCHVSTSTYGMRVSNYQSNLKET